MNVKLNLYNYADNLTIVETEKDIVAVSVTILAGDEIAAVIDCDGGYEIYEADNSGRLMDCYDGTYMIIDPEKIKAWAEWTPSGLTDGDTASYVRQNYFYPGGEYDELHPKN